jgi:hypothetical protein
MSRKVFTAGEVLAAADVNSFLMDQTVMSFAGTASRGSAIGSAVVGMVSYLEDIDSLSVNNGTAWTIDRTIQVFAGTAARGSAIPTPVEGMYAHLNDTDALTYYNGSSWVAAGGGGKILQVVSATSSTVVTNNSSTYVSTGLAATITPSSTSSKVMIFAKTTAQNPNNAAVATFTVFRGTVAGTDLAPTSAGITFLYTSAAANVSGEQQVQLVDSPNTTSAQTYTFAFKNVTGATGACTAQIGNTLGSIILMEVAA